MAGSAKKVTIGTITALFYIGLAVFFDAIKFVLFFADAIPFVGPPFGILGSYLVSGMEFLCITTGLYIAGAYRGKNNALTNVLWTMGMAMIDFVPLLNDFPSTTFAVIMIIMRSRLNDKVEEEENAVKHMAEKHHQNDQKAKQIQAQNVAQRVAGQRNQALAASIAYTQASTAAPPPIVVTRPSEPQIESQTLEPA